MRGVFQGAFNPVTVILIMVFGVVQIAHSDDDVEFNTDVLDTKERSNIDLSQFSKTGYVMPGKYQFVIHLNKSELPEQPVEFYVPENDPKGSLACLTPDIVKLLDLKEATLKSAGWWHDGQCLDIDTLPGITLRPDLGSSSLYISVPQAYLEYTAENWDPPSRWDNGIPGVVFDYNMNAMSTYQDTGGRRNDVSGNGTTGANLGPWRFRADWQAQYQQGQAASDQKKWSWSRYYAYRAITSLKAQLMMGENFLDSSLFDSFRYSGASLATDDKQLPPNLRGYAPEVTGVAKTNAKVTISQQGRVLYETTVASGPFRIQDLNSAVSGTLDVKVEEQDGSVRTWQVESASIPYLTRPGLVRYKVAVGKPSDMDHHSQGPDFATGEFSWGVNSGWSLYSGGIFAGDYNAAAFGVGRDLLDFGAISFDVTHSQAVLTGQATRKGNSYRLSYSKRFEEYDSQVTFAGYRFSERNYMNMSQYLDARYHENEDSGNDKELYTITMNKQFKTLNISTFLNYSHQTYWDREASDTWNLSVSNFFDVGRFKNISLSLSAFRTQYNDTKDDGMYLGLTVPWGESGTLSYNGQFSGGDSSNMVGYFDRIDDNNNYRLSTGTASGGNATGSGYFTHDGDLGSVSANASITGKNNSAFGLSLQGGMTATSQGAALHRTTTAGGTRMLVDTDGVSGVPVRGYGGVTHTNVFGKAVVGDINSYYHSSIHVDLDALPENVDATRSVVEGTLTEGAIGYRKFGILAGEKAMVAIKLSDGSAPPFGAEIRNGNGEQTGIIGDDGSTWLAGIRPGEQMDVSWSDGVQCKIRLPSPLPVLGSGLLLPCHPV